MASSTAKPPAPNLAALLAIKRKMAEKNEGSPDAKQLPPPVPIATGARSNEKISYRQDASVANPPGITAPTRRENPTEQTKISRKTKQLQVQLLDKKLEEINRKQEEKTNEALDTWKGFDSLNYGFDPTASTKTSTPPPPTAPEQQRTLTPPPEERPSSVQQPSSEKQPLPAQPRTPSPKRVDSPVKDQPKPKSPVKEEPIERRPSSPPPPLPRRSKVKSPEKEQLISNVPTPERSSPSLNIPSVPISNIPHLTSSPDIKHFEQRKPRHALKSIQRSMDRYRFHVW